MMLFITRDDTNHKWRVKAFFKNKIKKFRVDDYKKYLQDNNLTRANTGIVVCNFDKFGAGFDD